MTYGFQMTPQIESLQETLLLGRDFIQVNHGPYPAACAAVIKGDFFNLRERGEDLDDAQVDAFSGEGAAQKRAEKQGQDAVKGVDANLLVRPMMERPPTDEMRILHPLERFFDVMLAPVRP